MKMRMTCLIGLVAGTGEVGLTTPTGGREVVVVGGTYWPGLDVILSWIVNLIMSSESDV